MADYPAAHSMDSCWFALDADGCVGYFNTDEGGCMPGGDGFPAGGEAGGYGDDSLELWQLVARLLLARAQGDERLRSILPDDPTAVSDAVEREWDVEKLARYLGVYVYHCPDASAVPYVRGGAVNPGLRVGDLDERTRGLFVDCALPVRFVEAQQVQPGRHVEVVAWGDEWYDLDGTPHPTDDEPPRTLAPAELAKTVPPDWLSDDELEALANDDEFYAAVAQAFGG